MSGISTHVLDTSLGQPGQGIEVTLETRVTDGGWRRCGGGVTNDDGRVDTVLGADNELAEGVYRITFETGGYFERRGTDGFYPHASIVFTVRDASEHFHVPLLLNPFGYSTYRGS